MRDDFSLLFVFFPEGDLYLVAPQDLCAESHTYSTFSFSANFFWVRLQSLALFQQCGAKFHDPFKRVNATAYFMCGLAEPAGT
jgi:hypothetical protein